MSHQFQVRTAPAFVASFVAAVTVGVIAVEPAAAQRDRSLEVDVADCIEIESPAERFRCFESRVDAALEGQDRRRDRVGQAAGEASRAEPPSADPLSAAPPAGSAADAAASETPAARVEEERAAAPERSIDLRGPAGSSRSSAAERAVDLPEAPATAREAGPRGDEGESEGQEFLGTVASIRERLPSSYLITLENGQVWRQTRPSFYPLRPGHRVRIYPSNWGRSYRMSAEDLGGFIQVERVR